METNPDTDAAVCMLKSLPFELQGNLMPNRVLAMAREKPKIGDDIKTFAYPRSKIIPSEDDFEIGVVPSRLV
ncbi:MAG: hypothetical protein IPJ82_00890 [Lewinellaceae bacterium]|nr:hypothetical protein [Lewinellaceae bacterium]